MNTRQVVGWVLRGVAVGAIVGALPLVLPMLGEVSERASHVAAGGGGEKSFWGEPLFYAVVLIGASVFSFTGGLLGALAATITGALLTRWRPASPRIGLGAAAGALVVVGTVAFVQYGSFRFQVTKVSSSAEPAEYSGPCPTTVEVTGTITAEGGAGAVNYQFVGPSVTPYTRLVFDSPGTKQVSATWEVKETGRWRLIVSDARLVGGVVNSDGEFTITCTR